MRVVRMLGDVRMAEVAAEQWGVISVRQLRDVGIAGDGITVRTRRGRLHRLHRGVYAVGHDGLAFEGRALAAVMACGPGAVLSHLSAAAHWGFLDWADLMHVTVGGSAPRHHAGVRVHRTRWLERDDVWRHRGMWVTCPARTLLDLAATVSARMLRRAVRRAQALECVNVRQLADVVRRGGGRPGSRRLARLIAGGPAPTRSELEDVVLDLILSGGVLHPVVNERMRLQGRRVVPDFVWPSLRLVVEADGAAWHDDRLAREDDAERQALLEAHGFRVIRVTWDQAVARPEQTVARLVAAGAPTARLSG